jgi:hypothetical protein
MREICLHQEKGEGEGVGRGGGAPPPPTSLKGAGKNLSIQDGNLQGEVFKREGGDVFDQESPFVTVLEGQCTRYWTILRFQKINSVPAFCRVSCCFKNFVI